MTSTLRYPDDLPNTLANYEARLKELERRLPAINDAPPDAAIDCCDTYCDFGAGYTLSVGAANNTDLTVTIPRPVSGRFVAIASLQVEADVAGSPADFFIRTQFEIGGTRYFPKRLWRDQEARDGDLFAPVCHIVFDFHGPASNLAIALYVQNLGSEQILLADGQLTVMMRGRGGSTHCDPISSGTG